MVGLAACIGATVTLWGYGDALADPYFVSEKQLSDLKEHHEGDIESILTELAQQKKSDRIQRNHRELARLQRALIGENYANEAERFFILQEIDRLQKALACDEEDICQ